MSQTKPMNPLTAIVHLTQMAEYLEENDFSSASQDRAVRRAIAALRENHQLTALITDLWWFIENVTEEASDRTDRFFALRERVRELPEDK
jgi:hypothetical protein